MPSDSRAARRESTASCCADEPVLKRSLPDWLAEAPLGDCVLAFASAAPEHGGSGATYVLLRKP